MKPAPTTARRTPGAAPARRARGVGDRAQEVNVVEALRPGQPARRRSGRDQEVVVEKLLPVRRAHQAPRGLERDGAPAQEQLDLLLRVPARRPVGERARVDLPREHALRERRAIVRSERLVADDPDRSVVAAATQRLGAALRRRGRRRRSRPRARCARRAHDVSSFRRGGGRKREPGRRAASRVRSISLLPARQDAHEQQEEDRGAGDEQERPQPQRRGVRAGTERVHHAQHVDERRSPCGACATVARRFGASRRTKDRAAPPGSRPRFRAR